MSTSKKVKSKTWTISLLIIVILTIFVFGLVEFILDPIIHYGKEKNILTSYEYAEMYHNPGIANYYDYDSVMVGTSMVEHTDIDVCDRLWNCKMIRVPYSGGTTYNMKTILDVAFNSNNNIKTVFWELDEFQLFGSYNTPRHPLPTYLYNFDYKNDLNYLLNLDIFYHYTLKDIYYSFIGINQPVQHRQVPSYFVYEKEAVLNSYDRNSLVYHYLNEDYYFNSIDLNFENNIIPLIKNNTNTKFVFFMPPFSIMYWDRTLKDGSFDANMEGIKYALKQLIEYDNVEVYFYQCEKDIITNLDNYKDYSHYRPEINDVITQMISEGKNRITKDNLTETIDTMSSFIKSFDFDEIID